MRTNHNTVLLCAFTFMSLGLGIAAAQNGGTSSGYPEPKNDFTQQERRGPGLYSRYCAGCHGPPGEGNGENAPYIDSNQRDFTLPSFTCQSTPTTTVPTDPD